MMDRSTHLRFDPDTYPQAVERVQAWRAAMSISADMQFQGDDDAKFVGSLDIYPFNEALLCEIATTPHDAVRNAAVRKAWTHDHIILDLFIEGGFDGHVGGRPTSVDAGDCVLFDLKGPMRIRFRPMRCLALVMPRHLFEKAAGRPVAVDGLVFRNGSPEAGLLGPMLKLAISQVARLDEAMSAGFCSSLVPLIACCVTHAGSTPSRPAMSAAPPLPHLLRYVQRCATDPDFGIEHLCRHYALSRTALYRIFTPVGGVAETIRRCRVEQAVRLLRDGSSSLPLAKLALASGFADSRSLRRALRAVHDLSIEDIRTAQHLKGEGLVIEETIAALFDNL